MVRLRSRRRLQTRRGCLADCRAIDHTQDSESVFRSFSTSCLGPRYQCDDGHQRHGRCHACGQRCAVGRRAILALRQNDYAIYAKSAREVNKPWSQTPASAAVVGVLLSIAACRAPTPALVNATDARDLALVEQQRSLQLKNGSAGVQEIMPVASDHYSLAFQIGNDSGESAVIDSVTLVGSDGLTVGDDFAVGRPRPYGGMSSDIHIGHDETGRSRGGAAEGAQIAASGEDAHWGIIAVFDDRRPRSTPTRGSGRSKARWPVSRSSTTSTRVTRSAKHKR